MQQAFGADLIPETEVKLAITLKTQILPIIDLVLILHR